MRMNGIPAMTLNFVSLSFYAERFVALNGFVESSTAQPCRQQYILLRRRSVKNGFAKAGFRYQQPPLRQSSDRPFGSLHKSHR
mmetsp:Transcript_30663/g.72368  ORF Transcript_30663/g.72368 Transcript_30663/m.72368 type:complete len:83 (+) Transcript_30663:174-422(+)